MLSDQHQNIAVHNLSSPKRFGIHLQLIYGGHMANKKSVTSNDVPKWHRLKGALVEINPDPKDDDFILNIQQQQAEQEIMQQVWMARQDVYNKIYPEVKTFENDPHDSSACVIYTRTKTGKISSTARIAFDGLLGIPEKNLVPAMIGQFRDNDVQFAELGRFVIDDAARGVLPNYFRAFYQLGKQLDIDTYIMFVRHKWVSFYIRLMKATVVAHIEENFGSDSPYAVMTWNLKDTTPRFFSWCGAESDARGTAEGEENV